VRRADAQRGAHGRGAAAPRYARTHRREKVEDLVDPGSFVEYERFAIAAQAAAPRPEGPDRAHARQRPIGGTACADGRALAVLSYDTVEANSQPRQTRAGLRI
jgi:acetyl-CoA carboxylase carboxyltransferase component